MSETSLPTFTMELTATAEDIDVLQHVSNVVYVRWIQEVAEAHSRDVGWDLAAYQRLGAVWVIRRHEIDYRASAFAGDRLRLRTWVASWKAASCVRKTEITRMAGAGGGSASNGTGEIELVRGSTTWALVNMETGRPLRIPVDLRASFSAPPA